MKIETKRLLIKPLDENEMRNYILNDFVLESSLKLENHSRVVPDRVKKAIETKVLPNLTDQSKNNLYYTFWVVISKEQNKLVAEMCFKGEPNERGELEIGYATYPDFQLNGFMTEAISGLVNWAFQEENINTILAETDLNNIASIRVLEKNNFTLESQTKNNCFWRLSK
ncbi:GNAT family N-acetyltransferase [Chryseobacterium sp. SIMBA_029]|uniref:GNAT family N-acetyltransferase n=1 Tax=Chryseobacterium sp. SIMBA_029 TaxID=3085772 RepID=UPI003978A85E